MPVIDIKLSDYQTQLMLDKQQQLSDEDKKLLEEAHKNRDNPEHPAHKDHPKVPSKYVAALEMKLTILKHGEFLKSIPKRLGGAGTVFDLGLYGFL